MGLRANRGPIFLRQILRTLRDYVTNDTMHASAIIVAAGSGVRLGARTAKAFVTLGGATLLARSLRSLGATSGLLEAVVAVPAGRERAARREAELIEFALPLKIVAGGAERQDSVRLALELTSAEADLVIVHDAARPFATVAMFAAALAKAADVGAAIVALPLTDTLKQVDDETIRATIPRTGLWQAQTPQAFRRELLIRAHEQALRDGVAATDDADLVQRIGARVGIVAGSPLNLKITTPEDLRLAEAIASAR
jgi:2-C-methyl-D-erythritol 4-phosphate cytidylyltransferase